LHTVSWFFPLLYYILYLEVIKAIKKPSLFIILFISLAVCACENQLIVKILQPKTINFESNGGSHVPSQTVLKNERIRQPPDPVKANYSFKGWYTENMSTGNNNNTPNNNSTPNNNADGKMWNFNDMPEEDMTLYAWWQLL